MRQFFVISALLLWSSHVNAFDLECSSSYGQYWTVLGSVENCIVQGIRITDKDQKITSVNGKNDSLPSISGLIFNYGTMNYVPSGIGKFFPNLRGLKLVNLQLKAVKKADFEQLVDLEELHLESNNLKLLESDLFEGNSNLKTIRFNSNSLKYVGENLLKPLTNLQSAYFQNSGCINYYAQSDGISRLTQALRTQCTSIEELRNELFGKDFARYEMQIADLKKENKRQREYANEAARKAFVASKQLKACLTSNKDVIPESVVSEKVELTCENVASDEQNEEANCIAIYFKVGHSNASIIAIKDDSGDLMQSNITVLDIIHQHTFFLPTNLASQLPFMQKLTVCSSGLYEINAKTFEGMEELLSLNLSLNMIQEIPIGTFKDQKKLMELDLSFNGFHVLETGAFNGLANLQTLNLEGNFLSSIKVEVFEELYSLKTLSLKNNNLKFISANLLTPLKKIEFADFTNNICIHENYPEVTIESLEVIIIDNCIAPVELSCDFQAANICRARDLFIKYPKTKISSIKETESEEKVKDVIEFIAVNQNIKFLPFELVQQFPRLVLIVVETCNLTSLGEYDFKGFSSLKNISILNNNLTCISPATFDEVPQLEYLDLSNNHIQSLPSKLFLRLSNLKILILSNNEIVKITSDIMTPKNAIEVFQADHNQLEIIDMKILRYLRKAKTIDLSENFCIDMKYEKSTDTSKALVELTGEIYLNCSPNNR